MRSITERVIHTTLFELGAVAAVSPVIAWATGTALARAGALSLVLSAIATACNYGWTFAFDRLVPTRRRTLRERVAQAVGLEIIISVFAIPLFVLFAEATLLEAVLLDLGGAGFFVVYSMAYNLVFDRIMQRVEAASARRAAIRLRPWHR